MNRDPIALPLNRILSHSTGYKFFSLVDAIARYNEPTQAQLDALERSYNSTAKYVMDSDEFRDLVITVHVQGSRALGTIIRPTRFRPEGFDIDIVVRLRRTAMLKYGNDPVALINDLHMVVRRYAATHGLTVTRWERCITLEYTDGMCVDITPIVEDERAGIPYGETHAKVPDRKLKLFEPTNPKGLANSFAAAARVHAVFTATKAMTFDEAKARADIQSPPAVEDVQYRLLSRLVQLLKLHRNVAFGEAGIGPDHSPRSVFITDLAATAYATRAPIAHDSPLDLLLDIVDAMPGFIQRQCLNNGGEYWLLRNYTAPGDNLASGMNTSERQGAYFAWHHRLKADIERLLHCIEQREGLDQILEIVQRVFGVRAAQAVRELEAPHSVAQSSRRTVIVGTVAAATALAIPTRSHTFYGD
jgi:Second Messenger Oligonucleotide or Dinucleotide Synthetase domain